MTAGDLTLLVLLYLAVINAVAYAAFALDKERARNNDWRISEATLLATALAGGSLGTKLAQQRLRHKTRKEPFRSVLNVICLMQAAALASLFFPGPRAAAVTVFKAIAASVPAAAEPEKPLPRRFGPGS
ncbi:MAG: DUF1294 domain-containing protein [Proteobacteria bacterium]|nr:DUF1294 domain-containing protein [Pseudomonadota bacterium]